MSKGWESIGAILAAVVGLAIVAVLVSKNAQTPQVLQAASSGFSGILGAAVAPVTGTNTAAAGGFSLGGYASNPLGIGGITL